MLTARNLKQVAKHRTASRLFALILAFCTALLISCKNTTSIETPSVHAQSLTLVTLDNTLSYHKDENGEGGFEFLLAQAFADKLNTPLNVLVAANLEQLTIMLQSGQADFAAANLNTSFDLDGKVRFSKPYLDTSQVVVYRKGAKSPQSEADMISLNIQVQAGSSHENRLRSLRSTNPGLTWSATNVSTPELLQGVESGNFDLTIIDFNEYKAYHTRFPKTQVAFTLSPIEYIAWAFAKGKHGELLTKANAFIEEAKHSGTIAHLSEIYYGHFETTYQDGFNSHTFSRKVNNRLPKVKQLIKQTAAKHDMDWRLLAAISYQESHWRAKAKSPTGVRGMMMLTLPTAREMGVKNRLNAEQSLDGGARYLKKILKRLPDDIQEPDRTWMALAAYNVGLGHLNDAREITEFQGGDAQRWVDVKQRLPLLEEKHWYAFTQFGYARGHEPVTYVQRVRHYYELLNWYFPDEQQPNSTSNSKTELASLKNAEPSRG